MARPMIQFCCSRHSTNVDVVARLPDIRVILLRLPLRCYGMNSPRFPVTTTLTGLPFYDLLTRFRVLPTTLRYAGHTRYAFVHHTIWCHFHLLQTVCSVTLHSCGFVRRLLQLDDLF